MVLHRLTALHDNSLIVAKRRSTARKAVHELYHGKDIKWQV